jgi:hypothetical protein
VCPLCRVSTATAALDGFVVPRATHRCFQRLKSCPETLDRVRRRAPPPATAVGRHPLPASRLHASSAARSRSDASDSNPPASLNRTRQPPLDLDPTDLINLILSQPGQTQAALVILQKTPKLYGIHKNTLPQRQNPYSLVLFIYFSPDSFQIFADWSLHLL